MAQWRACSAHRASSCIQRSRSPRAVGLGRRPCPRLAARTATAEAMTETEESVYSGESFYDILNVSPVADKKTIKKAYLAMIKECHPDRSNVEANEFCALLNEIYETLSDPSRRAAYDALSGFSMDSVNPFLDTSFERDQVFVDEFACIGCRNCTNVCPKTFAIEEEFGRARVYNQGQDPADKQQEAIDTCPVSCIHWVSAPQLSLLEAAMGRMSRVAVWSLGMGGHGNRDVFTEASLAWQKRRSELSRRRAAMDAARAGHSAASSGWGGWWNNVVSFEGATGSAFYNQAAKQRQRQQQQAAAASVSSDDDYELPPMTDKDARNIAALAAKAARASRTWKVVQQTVARMKSRPLQIASESSMSSVSDFDDEA